ncbi:MAG: FAD:protein FMN transferase [Lachnospiraceae bacterium]|nr:FAD:protein FMN transferase [Lachnospiraceae bacterium]
MKHYIHLFSIISALLLLCLPLGSCSQASGPITKTSFKLNTVVTITIYDSSDISLLDHALELCDDYENLFSRTRETSELYQINQGEKTTLSPETEELLSIALSYSRMSGGLFDPSIGPVSSLWDFHAETPRVPTDSEIKEALPLINSEKIHISNHTIELENSMMLDLGAISKGYIADRIKEYLVEQGVKSAIIDLGGNVLCIGSRPDGTPFQIGIRQPFEDTSTAAATLSVTDQSVVTSGIYERCFTQDDVLYHHLLNPKTGYPCDNELASVTIVSDHSVDGDALSTCCFLMGTEQGMKLINSLTDVQAVFITREGDLLYSDGFPH